MKAFLDPDLYGERHKVQNLFQRILRIRGIALPCEETPSNFEGFAVLISALDWLG